MDKNCYEKTVGARTRAVFKTTTKATTVRTREAKASSCPLACVWSAWILEEQIASLHPCSVSSGPVRPAVAEEAGRPGGRSTAPTDRPRVPRGSVVHARKRSRHARGGPPKHPDFAPAVAAKLSL